MKQLLYAFPLFATRLNEFCITFASGMKCLAIAFSIYIIFLACKPCSDEVRPVPADNAVETLTTADYSSHSTAPDLCSPLCICSCCGGLVIIQAQDPLPFRAPVAQATRVFYAYFSIPNPSFTIWQPPKV
jgi:hypothetical protein